MIALYYAKPNNKCCSCNQVATKDDFMDFYKISFSNIMTNTENNSVILCKRCKEDLVSKLGG